jgi:hypothetical protein
VGLVAEKHLAFPCRIEYDLVLLAFLKRELEFNIELSQLDLFLPWGCLERLGLFNLLSSTLVLGLNHAELN